MNFFSKKAIWHLFKLLVFCGSIYFVYVVYSQNIEPIKSLKINSWPLLSLVISLNVLVYFVLMLGLGFAWLQIIKPKQKKSVLIIYLKSQALKYLPGNFFHFLYRHTETKKLAVSHKTLLTGTLVETLGLVALSILAMSLLILWPNQLAAIYHKFTIEYIMAGIFVTIFIALFILKSKTNLRTFIKLSAYYALYFFGMGLIVYLINHALGFSPVPLTLLIATYAVAWLSGYITPGAPGGVGIREAVFILLGTPMIEEYQALILIAMVRLIAVSAEVFLYFMAEPFIIRTHHLWAWFDKKEP